MGRYVCRNLVHCSVSRHLQGHNFNRLHGSKKSLSLAVFNSKDMGVAWNNLKPHPQGTVLQRGTQNLDFHSFQRLKFKTFGCPP